MCLSRSQAGISVMMSPERNDYCANFQALGSYQTETTYVTGLRLPPAADWWMATTLIVGFSVSQEFAAFSNSDTGSFLDQIGPL